MTAPILDSVKALRDHAAGDRVTFRAKVLRVWEVGGLRMCLVGDASALTRVELGAANIDEAASYEFRNAVLREYPGGWHSVALSNGSEAVRLEEGVAISQDEAYIERTFKILAGIQRKKGRKEGHLAPWRHPAEEQ